MANLILRWVPDDKTFLLYEGSEAEGNLVASGSSISYNWPYGRISYPKFRLDISWIEGSLYQNLNVSATFVDDSYGYSHDPRSMSVGRWPTDDEYMSEYAIYNSGQPETITFYMYYDQISSQITPGMQSVSIELPEVYTRPTAGISIQSNEDTENYAVTAIEMISSAGEHCSFETSKSLYLQYLKEDSTWSDLELIDTIFDTDQSVYFWTGGEQGKTYRFALCSDWMTVGASTLATSDIVYSESITRAVYTNTDNDKVNISVNNSIKSGTVYVSDGTSLKKAKKIYFSNGTALTEIRKI